MTGKYLINQLPLSKANELSSLVENRRAFTLNNLELNVYETYQQSHLVPLKFDDLVIINMITGRKVMHLFEQPGFDYMPGETIVVPPAIAMKIDFPEASAESPTQCTALAIARNKIKDTLQYLNEFFPREITAQKWDFQYDHYHFYNSAELSVLINKLFSIACSDELHKDVLADLALKELLIRVMQTQNVMGTEAAYFNAPANRMEEVRAFVRQHIQDNITIEALSKKAHMSQASFFRSFKEEMGISPMEYVIRERIKHAKQVLLTTQNLKEACYSSGFSNLNYFVRIFKKHEGLTPGAFLTRNY